MLGVQMKKVLLAAAAVTALVGAPALAADMAVKAPPVPAPIYGWTGPYVGLDIGFGWSRTSSDVGATDPATAILLSGPPTNFAPSQFASSFSQRGAVGGVQAGYNWQFSANWVAGLEADIQAANVNGSSSNIINLNPGFFGNAFPFSVNAQRTLDWFGTVRGRLGFLARPDLLIYGTGGLAYGRTTTNASVGMPGPPGGGSDSINYGAGGVALSCNSPAICYAGSNSQTSTGWAAGAGIEYKASSNVTLKLEYLHIDLGGQTVTLVSPPPSTPGVFMNFGFNREGVDIVRGGLTYSFGDVIAAK
jgi:outer membrane immunogenic protein